MDSFYFDTSIWIDVYDKRGVHGEVARKLLEKIIKHDFVLAYSALIITELKRLDFSDTEIGQIFALAKPGRIQRVHIFKDQKDLAKRIAQQRSVPPGDVLHAILARDNDLQLISRDHHFQKLKDITEVKVPEKFI